MIRREMLVLLAGLVLVSAVSAQSTAWRFRWQTGQVLTYRVEQVTTAAEEVGQEKSSSQNKLSLLKRWQVVQVDAAGVATLQLSLGALRLETTTPAGETLLFDSANLDKSSPQLKEQMQKYVGPPLAVLRIDSRGQVVEVKESKFGPASRYQNELPFIITLPENGPAAGQTWERAYQITLDPPRGAGEKHDAVQKYTCAKTANGAMGITFTTAVKTMPESMSDRVPLLEFQPEGEVIFDAQAGILRSARMNVNKEVIGHDGPNSRYRFQSSYSEQFVPNP